MNRGTTIEAFFETAAGRPERAALRRRLGPGKWTVLTWAE
jgi:hypothetical protein